MVNRNKENFIIVTLLYDTLIDFNYGEKGETRLLNELLLDDVTPFIKDNVTLAMANYGKIVKTFIPYLKNWVWERIPLLTQAILLFSYTRYFLYKQEPVDRKIVINTAIEIAKTYIDETQASFINGILENIITK